MHTVFLQNCNMAGTATPGTFHVAATPIPKRKTAAQGSEPVATTPQIAVAIPTWGNALVNVMQSLIFRKVSGRDYTDISKDARDFCNMHNMLVDDAIALGFPTEAAVRGVDDMLLGRIDSWADVDAPIYKRIRRHLDGTTMLKMPGREADPMIPMDLLRHADDQPWAVDVDNEHLVQDAPLHQIVLAAMDWTVRDPVSKMRHIQGMADPVLMAQIFANKPGEEMGDYFDRIFRTLARIQCDMPDKGRSHALSIIQRFAQPAYLRSLASKQSSIDTAMPKIETWANTTDGQLQLNSLGPIHQAAMDYGQAPPAADPPGRDRQRGGRGRDRRGSGGNGGRGRGGRDRGGRDQGGRARGGAGRPYDKDRRGGRGDPGERACFTCGCKFHLKRDCPHRERAGKDAIGAVKPGDGDQHMPDAPPAQS